MCERKQQPACACTLCPCCQAPTPQGHLSKRRNKNPWIAWRQVLEAYGGPSHNSGIYHARYCMDEDRMDLAAVRQVHYQGQALLRFIAKSRLLYSPLKYLFDSRRFHALRRQHCPNLSPNMYGRVQWSCGQSSVATPSNSDRQLSLALARCS